MATAVTYPGVYIEEIPSGVRTIVGVPTAVTAFVGRATKGPVNEAVDITAFGDYERIFGGLSLASSMSFAVRDFYLNGGGRAVIVRVFSPSFTPDERIAALAAVKKVEAAAVAETTGEKAKAAAKAAYDGLSAKWDKTAAEIVYKAIDAVANDANQEAVKAAATPAVNAANQTLPVTRRDIVVRSPAQAAVKRIVDAASSEQTGAKAKEKADAEWKKFVGEKPPAFVKAVARKAFDEILKLADDANQAAVSDALTRANAVAPPELTFRAKHPGKGGGALRLTVERPVDDEGKPKASAKDPAKKLDVPPEKLFNLTITDTAPAGTSETYLNVTLADSVRRVDKVLKNESHLVEWAGAVGDPDFSNFGPKGADEVTIADWALADAKKANNISPDPQKLAQAQAAYDAAVVSANSTSDGSSLDAQAYVGDSKSGLFALEQLFTRGGIFNLLCIPPDDMAGDTPAGVLDEAVNYCEKRRAMLVVDPPTAWKTVADAQSGFGQGLDGLPRHRNAAVFFPRLKQTNPLRCDQVEPFVPCGVATGIFARTDAQRGVWKSPAGLDAALRGVHSLHVPMTDEENGLLNPLGINCLRQFPVFGRVVWGARTLRGADDFADEYKYIAVRRTALFIEESLYRGLKWVVFEPNDEPLWAQIRLSVGAFMNNLFRQGAFQGASARDAYRVTCDATTTTQNDINLGIVNVHVGFAPLKPAEFVIVKIQQLAGQIAT